MRIEKTIGKKLLKATVGGIRIKTDVCPSKGDNMRSTSIGVDLSQEEVLYIFSELMHCPYAFEGTRLKEISPEEVENRFLTKAEEVFYPEGFSIEIQNISFPAPVGDVMWKCLVSRPEKPLLENWV